MPAAARWVTIVVFVAFAALFPRASHADAERVEFDSAARDSSVVQIFQREAAYTDRIHGALQLPSRGAAPFPAMVIMHSSRGIVGAVHDWALLLNDLGVATLTVDSFEAVLLDGRALSAEERVRYSKNCPGYGAARGGDSRYAAASRERVRQFVSEQFKLR